MCLRQADFTIGARCLGDAFKSRLMDKAVRISVTGGFKHWQRIYLIQAQYLCPYVLATEQAGSYVRIARGEYQTWCLL